MKWEYTLCLWIKRQYFYSVIYPQIDVQFEYILAGFFSPDWKGYSKVYMET